MAHSREKDLPASEERMLTRDLALRGVIFAKSDRGRQPDRIFVQAAEGHILAGHPIPVEVQSGEIAGSNGAAPTVRVKDLPLNIE